MTAPSWLLKSKAQLRTIQSFGWAHCLKRHLLRPRLSMDFEVLRSTRTSHSTLQRPADLPHPPMAVVLGAPQPGHGHFTWWNMISPFTRMYMETSRRSIRFVYTVFGNTVSFTGWSTTAARCVSRTRSWKDTIGRRHSGPDGRCL
jgi:hypothetical protein